MTDATTAKLSEIDREERKRLEREHKQAKRAAKAAELSKWGSLPPPSKPLEDFGKIPRLTRACVITEKLDGTNASIFIGEDGEFLTGSRTQWITPLTDNFGFALWAQEHKDELLQLGPGHHFGEWWGRGIQRGYGLTEKRFSLFNVGRWNAETPPPTCCHVVPTLYADAFDTAEIMRCLSQLAALGSQAASGFMKPEGIVIYHTAARQLFKKTIEDDEVPKALAKATP